MIIYLFCNYFMIVLQAEDFFVTLCHHPVYPMMSPIRPSFHISL